MATPYGDIEAGIATALLATGTPFQAASVRCAGGELSDRELAEEIERMATIAPAALVFYAGGDSNKAVGGELNEMAQFSVVCVAASGTREAGAVGLYTLLKWVTDSLHGAIGGGILNSLVWTGNRRLSPQGYPVGVAAATALFETLIVH